MSWITPKTDWDSDDYFNIEDYARIVNNLEWLRTKSSALSSLPEWTTMTLTKTYTDLPLATMHNDIEHNLYYLNEETFGLDIGSKKTYYDNQVGFTYNDLNRIESACDSIKRRLLIYQGMPFILGQYKLVRP